MNASYWFPVYLKGSETDSFSICWLTLQMPTSARAGPEKARDVELNLTVPCGAGIPDTWATTICCLQGYTLAGSCSWNLSQDSNPNTLSMGFRCSKQWPTLCQMPLSFIQFPFNSHLNYPKSYTTISIFLHVSFWIVLSIFILKAKFLEGQ